MKFLNLFCVALGCALLGQPLPGQTASKPHHPNVKAADVKWQRTFPELAEGSPEMAILHVDPTTTLPNS